MRTINLDELQFCGQCGSKLLPDKSCPKRDCPVSSRATNANYSTTATTLPFGERHQSRISQTFDSLLDDTLSTSRAHSLSRPKRNRRRVIVLTVLVIMLVSAVFIGVEIGKGNAAGTANTGQNNPSTSAPPNSGTSISNS